VSDREMPMVSTGRNQETMAAEAPRKLLMTKLIFVNNQYLQLGQFVERSSFVSKKN
jgi:hypothetical protein